MSYAADRIVPYRIDIYKPRGGNGPRDIKKYYENQPEVWIRSITTLQMREDRDLLEFHNFNKKIKEVYNFESDAKGYQVITHNPLDNPPKGKELIIKTVYNVLTDFDSSTTTTTRLNDKDKPAG